MSVCRIAVKPCVCRPVGFPDANVKIANNKTGVTLRPIDYWRLWLLNAVLVSAGALYFLTVQYGTYEFFGRACLMALLPFIPVMVLVGGAGSTVFALTKVTIEKRLLKKISRGGFAGVSGVIADVTARAVGRKQVAQKPAGLHLSWQCSRVSQPCPSHRLFDFLSRRMVGCVQPRANRFSNDGCKGESSAGGRFCIPKNARSIGPWKD